MDVATNNHNPNPLMAYADHLAEMLTVYVPDFKAPTVALATSSGDFTFCKKMFLEADWVTPDLCSHVES
jgi:hypothetical protein